MCIYLITFYEASRGCAWLRPVFNHSQERCGMSAIISSPTIIYEDNTARIAQVSKNFTKDD